MIADLFSTKDSEGDAGLKGPSAHCKCDKEDKATKQQTDSTTQRGFTFNERLQLSRHESHKASEAKERCVITMNLNAKMLRDRLEIAMKMAIIRGGDYDPKKRHWKVNDEHTGR